MSETIQKVTLTISTALSGDDRRRAEDTVLAALHDSFGLNLELGLPGYKLPFELESIKSEPMTEEDIPRP